MWWTVVDFPADEPATDGWIAVTGVEVDGARRDVSTTRSVAIHGSQSTSGLELDPFEIQLTDLGGTLRFTSFALRPGTPDALGGDVRGELVERRADQLCTYDLRGSVTGQLDTAPARYIAVDPIIAPFEPIALHFVEPVIWADTTAEIVPSSMFVLEPDLDTRPGFAVGANIRPLQLWQAGANIDVTLPAVTDAAANVASFELSMQTLAAPDSNVNLGLESIDPFGWITAGDTFLASSFDCAEASAVTHVAPVEGTSMLLLQPDAKLVGFLRPNGATRLRLSVGLCDESPVNVLQGADRGVEIELITSSERVRVTGSAGLPHPTDSQARWTGFANLDVPLPASAADGFWLQVTTMGAEPPVHFPSVLVDAAAFSSP